MKPRLMLVEDHAMVRQGLVAILELDDEFEVVAEAGDADTAVRLHREHRPDLTLVDLRLPGGGGVQVIQAVLREATGARFLVLTTYDGEEDVARALQSGAHGYLLKGMDRSTLVEAIRAVLAGRRYIPAELADRLLPRPGAEAALSPREHDVLTCIASGMTNREIAEELAITESTVKAHVNSLLAKLGVTDCTKALVVAARRGLVRLG